MKADIRKTDKLKITRRVYEYKVWDGSPSSLDLTALQKYLYHAP